MFTVVGAAGLAGFLASAILLWSGLTYMPVRYGLACLAGYIVFLSLMNLWLRRTVGTDAAETLVDTANALDVPGSVLRTGRAAGSRSADGLLSGGRSGGGGATASFAGGPATPPPIPVLQSASNQSPGLDLDLDGDAVKLLPLLAVAAIVVGLVASAGVVWQAPHLLAEILVDAALAGATYGRLRASKTDWTFGVARRTWKPALAIMATCVLLGWAGHVLQPGADSIGDFFRSR